MPLPELDPEDARIDVEALEGRLDEPVCDVAFAPLAELRVLVGVEAVLVEEGLLERDLRGRTECSLDREKH